LHDVKLALVRVSLFFAVVKKRKKIIKKLAIPFVTECRTFNGTP